MKKPPRREDGWMRVTSHEGVGFPRLDLGSREVRPSDLLLLWIRLIVSSAVAWSLSMRVLPLLLLVLTERGGQKNFSIGGREDGCCESGSLTVRNVRMRRVC